MFVNEFSLGQSNDGSLTVCNFLYGAVVVSYGHLHILPSNSYNRLAIINVWMFQIQWYHPQPYSEQTGIWFPIKVIELSHLNFPLLTEESAAISNKEPPFTRCT